MTLAWITEGRPMKKRNEPRNDLPRTGDDELFCRVLEIHDDHDRANMMTLLMLDRGDIVRHALERRKKCE